MVLEEFEAMGLDPVELCTTAHVDIDVVTDREARVPRDTAGQLWRAALELSKDRFIGLHAGEKNRRKPNHLLEVLFAKGSTLGDGIRAGLRFQELIAHGKVASLEEEADFARLRINKVQGDLPVTHHEIEFMAATFVNQFRMATANRFRLSKITFAHPYRGMIESYERVFGCPVYFGERETEFIIPRDSWNLPLVSSDPDEQRRLEDAVAVLHEKIELPGFLSAASRSAATLLAEGRADLAAVAAALHLSPRTLQRRLQEEGTSFRALLDATRRAIVREGLESKRPRAEIARRAGFANERGVSRALRRWRQD